MFSTHLSLVLLLLPLLALRGAGCLDPEDIHGNQESVKATEKERKQDVKEVVETKYVPDEIMQDPVEYIKKGDDEDKLIENTDIEKREREGRRIQERKKGTNYPIIKKSKRKSDRDLHNAAKRKNKGKRPLNIMKLLKDDEDSTKTKKKKPDKKTDKNGKGNRKGPPRRKQNIRAEQENDDDGLKKEIKKVQGNRKINFKRKNSMRLGNNGATNSLVTMKKHPVFSFAYYVLASCGQTYMVTKSTAFLFTTDGGQFSRNCRTNFQSPKGTTIKFYCPVFSLSQKKCKKESLLVSEKNSKWQFCKTDVVDIETFSNSLMVHHRRRRLAHKKCPGAFLCEVSLGAHYGPVTQKPHPVHPGKPTVPYPGPVTQKPHPVYPVKPTGPHPGPVTQMPYPVYPVWPIVPYPGPITQKPHPVYPVKPTNPHPEPITTPKPIHPGPVHPGPIPPGPLPPGPVYPPGPVTPVKPPAPIGKPPQPTGARPICYGCSPFDITVTRIVGGAEAGVGEFPFQARLDIGPGTMCSGSLISKDFVLTAAHCYSSGFRYTDVILGDHNIRENEPFSKKLRAISVIKHRDFDSTNMDNDIALLQLEYPVQFTKHIAPICLSTPKDNFNSGVAVASGWGHTQYSGFVSNTLQKVALDSITHEECQDMYLSKYEITKNMLCTYTEEKDACQGDSGGPLVRKERDGTWVLVGITSFGYKCAYQRSPGVFTSVANYKDWISQNMGRVKC